MIRKSSPFKFRKITDQYPPYSKWLAEQIRKLDDLPDFSDDKRIFVMSDYGGEHKQAAFSTYAFLISAVDKLAVFERKTHALRVAHGLTAPFKEFAYKDLGYGPIERTVGEFLRISDHYIHGVLVTISVDKSIPSLFGPEKKAAQQGLVQLLSTHGLGEWGNKEAEKLLRVSHAIAMFLAVLTHSGQRFLWMSDRDAITEDGGGRTFENTQHVFMHALRMYTDNEYDICGFAKSFDHDPFTCDLLSLADFAAGAIQDVLQAKYCDENDVKNSSGKRDIIRWLATSSIFLKKVNILFKMDAGRLCSGKIVLTPRGSHVVQ